MRLSRLLRMPLALLLLGAAPAAYADCQVPIDAAEQLRCASADLRTSDQEINRTYQALRGLLSTEEQLALRDEQRAWLRLRDQTCVLDRSISDREQWFRALELAPLKLTCVIRYTQERNKRLTDWLAQRSAPTAAATAPDKGAAPPPPPKASAAATGYGTDSGIYEIVGGIAHISGKWYYEVEVQRSAIARRAEVALTMAVTQSAAPGGGYMHLIRRADVNDTVSKMVFGIAIDLDDGFTYIRKQGFWRTAPGYVGGDAMVKPRMQTTVVVGSSVDMTDMIEEGLIRVNFGDQPFQHEIPAGYRPFAEQ